MGFKLFPKAGALLHFFGVGIDSFFHGFCRLTALGSECYTYKKLSQADRAMSNTDQSNIKSDDKAPNASVLAGIA